MTLFVNIGRRVPRNWAKRTMSKVGGLLTFQENIWIMINNSLKLAKKKATEANNGVTFTLMRDNEHEDIAYDIEWIKVIIQGTRKQELEEQSDTMKMYDAFGTTFKKHFSGFGQDPNLKKQFKSKILSEKQVNNAYDQGYGSLKDTSVSQKLLEMGIMTHVDFVDDFVSRGIEREKQPEPEHKEPEHKEPEQKEHITIKAEGIEGVGMADYGLLRIKE